MENKEETQFRDSKTKKNWSEIYNKWYKKLLIPPLLITLFCIIYLAYFFFTHNDILLKDTSLSGGTVITLNFAIDEKAFESNIKPKFSDIVIRRLADLSTGEIKSYIIETSSPPEKIKPEIEKFLGFELSDKNSSIEFTGPSLSKSFYKQLLFALMISFILMSLTVFFIFRTFVPSIAIIGSILGDIIFPLTIINLFGIRVSAAGIAAFLMLIGYSVDTDILLTTRVLKTKEGDVNHRIFRAFKTGIVMTLTALVAVLPVFLFVSGLPDSFQQIFLILTLGLLADIPNTWLTNASIIKWYSEKKESKK